MRRRRIVTRLATAVLTAALVAGVAACGAGGKDEAAKRTTTTAPQVTAKMSAYKIATLDGQFGQFRELVDLAGLRSELESKGPYTVLAPSSAAIIKLGKRKIDDLKSDKARLKQVLENHLVKGELTLAGLAALDGRTMVAVSGATLPVKVKGSSLTVGGAKVVKSDIDVSNGMVFVLDGLVTPAA